MLSISTDQKNTWKNSISFSQMNDGSLTQNLRCLQDYEVVELCIKDLIVSGLRYHFVNQMKYLQFYLMQKCFGEPFLYRMSKYEKIPNAQSRHI